MPQCLAMSNIQSKIYILVPGMFDENFMQIGALKRCQDSPRPSSDFLESWRTWRFLTPLLVVEKSVDGWMKVGRKVIGKNLSPILAEKEDKKEDTVIVTGDLKERLVERHQGVLIVSWLRPVSLNWGRPHFCLQEKGWHQIAQLLNLSCLILMFLTNMRNSLKFLNKNSKENLFLSPQTYWMNRLISPRGVRKDGSMLSWLLLRSLLLQVRELGWNETHVGMLIALSTLKVMIWNDLSTAVAQLTAKSELQQKEIDKI